MVEGGIRGRLETGQHPGVVAVRDHQPDRLAGLPQAPDGLADGRLVARVGDVVVVAAAEVRERQRPAPGVRALGLPREVEVVAARIRDVRLLVRAGVIVWSLMMLSIIWMLAATHQVMVACVENTPWR